MCANIMWKIGPVACAVHRGRYAANLPESLQRLARVMAKLLLSRIFVSPLLRPIHFTLAAPILLAGCATAQGDSVASASTSPPIRWPMPRSCRGWPKTARSRSVARLPAMPMHQPR